MFSSVKKFLGSAAVSAIILGGLSFSHTANAGSSPIACSIYSNPVEVTYPGTLDQCETEPVTWCEEGFLCCGVAYPAQITRQKFDTYRTSFIMNTFYTNTVEPDFKKFADEGRNAGLFRLATWGAFIDASVLSDTLKDLQFMSAQSVQSYTPSEQICKIGTLSSALASSEAKMDADRLVLGEAGLIKNLGRKSSISAAGYGQESTARLQGFVENFCDLQDNNNGMEGMCQVATPVTDLQQNRDVDYTRLMGNGVTINADLTNSNLTQDEASLFAISHFLYGHRQPSKRIGSGELNDSPGTQNLYSEYRSVAARRAAAQNSYNTQAAMKMAGSGGSDTYMKNVLSYIGVSAADADVFLGAKTSADGAVKSSYNAQMNLLTKQIYQDPNFYANLMDSRANVKRTSAALQGIGLMQQRDTYKSMARSEMLTALLVELEARRIANNVIGAKATNN